MDRRQSADLDRHITGNYGEDQFRGEEEFETEPMIDAASTDKFEELKQAIIEYLDNRPDDEQGTTKSWAKFVPFQRKLEKLLDVEEGRWG